MKSDIIKKTNEENDDVAAYEEARIDKSSEKNPEPVTDAEVESANIRINPDGDSMDSRG